MHQYITNYIKPLLLFFFHLVFSSQRYFKGLGISWGQSGARACVKVDLPLGGNSKTEKGNQEEGLNLTPGQLYPKSGRRASRDVSLAPSRGHKEIHRLRGLN